MATITSSTTPARVLDEAYASVSGKSDHEAGLRAAVEADRNRIREVIYTNGYDWSHDPGMSGLQHLLNWLDGHDD